MWGKLFRKKSQDKAERLRQEQLAKDRLQFETIDLRLIEPLNRLHQTPPRDPNAAEASRLRFLEQLEEDFPTGGKPFGMDTLARKLDFLHLRSKTRPLLTVLWAIVLLAVALFGSAGITAHASQTALPGDRLYLLKTGLEQMQLRLSGNLSQQIDLSLSFASHRMDEMEHLIQAGRYSEALSAAQEFQTHLEKANVALNLLYNLSPTLAARHRAGFEAQTESFSARLSGMSSKMPATFQSLLRAKLSSPMLVDFQPYDFIEQNHANLEQEQNLTGREGYLSATSPSETTAATPEGTLLLDKSPLTPVDMNNHRE